jgi:hypothetical protein
MNYDDKKRNLIYFLVGINVIPHALTVPTWVIGVSVVFLLWGLSHYYRSWPLPRSGFLKAIVALGGAGIFFQYGTVMGQEPATALLVLMVSAKLLELRKFRDAVVVILLCYLILMAKLIESQSMEMTLFMVFDVLLITAVLATLYSSSTQGKIRFLMRRSLIFALQSMPLAFVLFVVFPRFSLNLWSQSKKVTGETGFSDSLRPGRVAHLAESDKVAFRVSFPERQPGSVRGLYWRGLVLTLSRGLDWDKGDFQKAIPVSPRAPEDGDAGRSEITQDIFFEPSPDPYLFALDWPAFVGFSGDPTSRLVRTSEGKTFESKINLSSRLYYRAFSVVDSRKAKWISPDPEIYLKVVGGVSSRVEDLAKEFLGNGKQSSREIVDRILYYFTSNKFRYTLKPGEMTDLDDFLFSKRVGFCEHYAGAMASLLRLAGVSSRVVVGFQGGTPSLLNDYYFVRYLDAHAWVEFWDSGKETWMRVDPVEAISPQRIAMGAAAYSEMVREDVSGIFNTQNLPKWLRGGLGEVGERIRLIWDQTESLWVNFLLRYDWSFQKDILKKWGVESYGRWVFILAGVLLSAMTVIFALFILRGSHDQTEPDLELYRLLCDRLSRAGLVREKTEGPLEFWSRAKSRFPQANLLLDSIFEPIIESRYGRSRLDRKKLSELRYLIKRLRIQGRREEGQKPKMLSE